MTTIGTRRHKDYRGDQDTTYGYSTSQWVIRDFFIVLRPPRASIFGLDNHKRTPLNLKPIQITLTNS